MSKARRGRQALIWALRILLALVFVYQGLDKLGERRLWIRVFGEIGIGQWFRYATGILEATCGVMLLVPRLVRIAAVALMCTMVGALLVHALVIGFGPQTALVCALLLMLLVVLKTSAPANV